MAPSLENGVDNPIIEYQKLSVEDNTTNGSTEIPHAKLKNATHTEPFVIQEQPAFTRRKLKIVCIGAGYSGLTLAHKIMHEHKLEDVLDLTIYEKNADVGGTWYENRYPGAAW